MERKVERGMKSFRGSTVGSRLRAGLLAMACLLMMGPAFAAPASSASTGVVNVNTATAEELQRLPGVGEVRAGAILAIRKERGGFKSIDELEEVRGIGPAMLGKMRPHVTLKGKTTVFDSATATTKAPNRKGKSTNAP